MNSDHPLAGLTDSLQLLPCLTDTCVHGNRKWLGILVPILGGARADR
jgi:hypothetical protein